MMENLRDSGWLCEYDSPYEARILKIKESILSVKTKYQKMDLVETYTYGKALFLDEKIQCSELDGFIYHEALVMPSLIIHPDPKTILITGGGDGFTLRQVLQLKGLEKIVMVDIDREVVLAAKEHLQFFHKNSFLDPKVELRFGDGRKYLEGTDQIFDVIIIDVTDPIEKGPSYLLYSKEFYGIARKKLATNGIVAAQAGVAKIGNLLCFLSVKRTLEEMFLKVRMYTAFIPCFGSAWGFIMASETIDPLTASSDEIDRLIGEKVKSKLKFYDGECHRHMFSLPKYLRSVPGKTGLHEKGKIIRDDAPLFVP